MTGSQEFNVHQSLHLYEKKFSVSTYLNNAHQLQNGVCNQYAVIHPPACKMSMFGNSRNGRAVKLALVVGLFLVVLYFLISWRVEAQSLTQNLADVEGEYQALMKRYHGLERELKGNVNQ